MGLFKSVNQLGAWGHFKILGPIIIYASVLSVFPLGSSLWFLDGERFTSGPLTGGGVMASHTFLSLLLFYLYSFHLLRPIYCSFGSNGFETTSVPKEEEFSEELLLKPLPDYKVLAHFHFTSISPPSSSNGKHHHLFPKSIAQLVKKYKIRELELSFTQGRWNYDRWGASDPLSTANGKPPGVELWALFDIPTKEEIDATWRNLTHSLSGLFCASINFLESSTSYSAPLWGFLPNNGDLRYGALPREAVCTENLTPWLKLLPCRDKAGIASLLDRPSIYRGHYHSQRLKLRSDGLNGIVIEQTLSVVLQPIDRTSWSMHQLFKKSLTGKCALAKSSKVFLEIERSLVSQNENILELVGEADMVTNDQRDHSTIYQYNVERYSEHEALDIRVNWKKLLQVSFLQAPLHASRFLMGSGNERGSIAISLQSARNSTKGLYDNSKNCFTRVVILQVVPWYVKVYYHTLRIYVDGAIRDAKDVVEKINVTPSEDKVSPGTLEMMLQFPCGMMSAALILDFDKGFLHIDEYPPDANQGFDIPSALVSFPDFISRRIYPDSISSPLLQSYKGRNIVKSYTEVLLVPLTTPDFSMPYNVITFTCTVLALYFGSMVNVLRRRVSEEERLAKSKDKRKPGLIPLLISKISNKVRGIKEDSANQSQSSEPILGPKVVFKVVLIALIAVLGHYFFNSS
ncbi:GPI transamidase component GPI16 [Rhynchospora pubera]|uniref:GPI transamidase component GPI16 n=1 Tax=Rhynchospora pubera TaxID=906938 RepID=A0AAV8FP55_9POAL|nr:GPI transamidase component GPI16 [Rhynchospora pubera]